MAVWYAAGTAGASPELAVACQRSGAYLWFPCKNFEGDEPERVILHYTIPADLTAIGNGRLKAAEGLGRWYDKNIYLGGTEPDQQL